MASGGRRNAACSTYVTGFFPQSSVLPVLLHMKNIAFQGHDVESEDACRIRVEGQGFLTEREPQKRSISVGCLQVHKIAIHKVSV